jgi:1-deoxy-D-xylulose-5-phosphate synthase
VITLEDGELEGGFGERVARFYGSDSMKVKCYGASKEFINHIPVSESLERFGIVPEKIVRISFMTR